MKKNLILLSIAVITILFFTNCDLTKTNEPTDMKDLVADPAFQFNTSLVVQVTLASQNVEQEIVGNAFFQLYKNDPTKENPELIISNRTNSEGVFEGYIIVPTYLDTIYLRSDIGFIQKLSIIDVDNQHAKIDEFFIGFGSSSTQLNRGGNIKDPLGSFPPRTTWAINNQNLYYYILSGGTVVNDEGPVQGVQGTYINCQAFTISGDGIIYFINNESTSKLYKILPEELDKNPYTVVNATYIGDTGLSVNGTDEITGMDFIENVLYGIGIKSKKIYEINISDGSSSLYTSLDYNGNFEAQGLNLDADGNLYTILAKNRNSELWKIDFTETSSPITRTIKLTWSYKIKSLTLSTDGYLYANDPWYWWIINPTIPCYEYFDFYPSYIEGMDFYLEGPGPQDSDEDGVIDSEDAYPNDPTRAYQSFTPSETEFATLMYEDLWPSMGDYDMNDLVLDYQICEITNAQHQMVEDSINFNLRASGAGYTLGFAIKFPSDYVLGDPVDPTFNLATLEASDNVIRFFNNQRTIFGVSGSEWINTTDEGLNIPEVEWTVTIPISNSKGSHRTGEIWDLPPYNPFIFVNNRGHEIHLPDYPPTALMDTPLFNTGDDDSDSSIGRYFRTANNMPWAINVTECTVYPLETYQITEGFLRFADWVESSGDDYSDWYSNTGSGYRDNDCIYFPPQD